MSNSLFTGTAGWAIPQQLRSTFPDDGHQLQRYAQKLNCVEINSSFYREHKYETYQKWASFVPADFRYAVKLSGYFTHEHFLQETGSYLKVVIHGISGLKEKWGVLLVQLPPSLEFELPTVDRFLSDLRKEYGGPIVWEPHHISWTQERALYLLEDYCVNKVLADPEPCRIPKTNRRRLENIRYFRLHGTPQMYKSRYSIPLLQRLSNSILYPADPAQQTWCIFDNTTYGFATENALELNQLVQYKLSSSIIKNSDILQ